MRAEVGRVNILIVDDRPEQLLSLEAVLAPLGENIVKAASGREALRHLLQEEFAVILLDIKMPEIDGFETATLIRKRRSTLHTPIIFLTAHTERVYVERSYSLGAVDYIMTPFAPEVLRTKVSCLRRSLQEDTEDQAPGGVAARARGAAPAAQPRRAQDQLGPVARRHGRGDHGGGPRRRRRPSGDDAREAGATR